LVLIWLSSPAGGTGTPPPVPTQALKAVATSPSLRSTPPAPVSSEEPTLSAPDAIATIEARKLAEIGPSATPTKTPTPTPTWDPRVPTYTPTNTPTPTFTPTPTPPPILLTD